MAKQATELMISSVHKQTRRGAVLEANAEATPEAAPETVAQIAIQGCP